MARTRIYAKNVKITYEGHELHCDHTSAVLTRADGEGDETDNTKTFCDPLSGANARVWNFNVSAIQSTDTSAVTPEGESLWTAIWDAAETSGGGTFDVVIAPHGNLGAPTVDQPEFTFTVQVDEGGFPDLGGAAGGDAFTFDYTFLVNGAVTKVTA